MPLVFPFDPDIRRAATIPSRLYVDPVYLELERDQVFARTWQLVGRSEQLRESGDFITARIGREAVVVVHDGDGLRGFHNVCLHRAGPVAEGCGHRRTLQCRYHGWTYRLDGSLLRAPEMEGAEAFDPDAMRLLGIQVAAWGPLVFANLDLRAAPLADFLEDIPARTARFEPAAMRFVTRKSWTVACNWKVYVDNYLEGYHLPVVHPGLYKELDYDAYRVEPHRYYSLQHAPLREGTGPDRKYQPRRNGDDAQYYWLFPNTMLNIYQGQMQTNQVVPLGPDRCEVVFEWYATEPPADPATEAQWTRLVEFSDEIQDEDIAICERVQQNLESRWYDRGRYSPARETGVHHFHGLLHEFLT